MNSPLIAAPGPRSPTNIDVCVLRGPDIDAAARDDATTLGDTCRSCMYHHPGWLPVLRDGLQHEPFLIQARRNERTVGRLSLEFIQSRLFGRFLVSLPYVNTAGVTADDDDVAAALIDRAIQLADDLDVRYLELRHERPVTHPALNHQIAGKVHMRLALPAAADELWRRLDAKVRNQIRKGEKSGLSVHWGGADLLAEFYAVYSHNMRDLGTPNFGRRLFQRVLEQFPQHAEICVVRFEHRAVAAASLLHGPGMTEVPTAGALRRYSGLNANMLMYWHLLQRTIARGQTKFDFGRSTPGTGTFRFKQQWDAQPEPAVWQYYVRRGTVGEMRPDSPRYARLIRLWRRLPVWLTRQLGPKIVRGIP